VRVASPSAIIAPRSKASTDLAIYRNALSKLFIRRSRRVETFALCGARLKSIRGRSDEAALSGTPGTLRKTVTNVFTMLDGDTVPRFSSATNSAC
jgi:hypothetical protein